MPMDGFGNFSFRPLKPQKYMNDLPRLALGSPKETVVSDEKARIIPAAVDKLRESKAARKPCS